MYTIRLSSKNIEIKKDIIIPIIVLIFTASYYIDSYSLSRNALALPRLLIIVILLCSAIIIKSSVKIVNQAENKEVNEKEPINIKLIRFVGMFIFLIIIWQPIGVYIAVSIFLIAAMYSLGERSLKKLLIIPVVVLVAIYLIFDLWLKLSLPMGILNYIF